MLTLCLMESGPIWLRDGDFRSLDIRHFCKSLSDATPGKIFECLVARNRNIGISRGKCELFVPCVFHDIFDYPIVKTILCEIQARLKSKLSNGVSEKIIGNGDRSGCTNLYVCSRVIICQTLVHNTISFFSGYLSKL